MISIFNKVKTVIKENQNKNENFITISISVSVLALILTIFILMNINSNSQKSFKVIASEVNKINLSVENCIDITTDTDNTIQILNNNNKALKELQVSIDNINISSKEDELIKHYLQDSLSNTLALYDLCLNIINAPKEITSGKTLDELNYLKGKCTESYKLLKENNIYIYFSDKSLAFFDNIYNYVNNLIKFNRDSEIKNSKQRDFLFSINSFLPLLDSISEDLIPAIEKIREDSRDLQVILDDINTKKETLGKFKDSVYSLSVPDGFVDIYDSLSSLISIYEIYINSLTEAVLYEKGCSDIAKYKSELDKYYKNTNSKYEDVLLSYTKFKQLINNL